MPWKWEGQPGPSLKDPEESTFILEAKVSPGEDTEVLTVGTP